MRRISSWWRRLRPCPKRPQPLRPHSRTGSGRSCRISMRRCKKRSLSFPPRGPARKKRLPPPRKPANNAREAYKEERAGAIQSSFDAVQDQLKREKEAYEQKQEKIEAARTDESREAAIANNKAFVVQLLEKLSSGAPDGAKEAASAEVQETQAAKVEKRAARVMQGQAVEKRMRRDFSRLAGKKKRNPAKEAESWKKMHDDYFQRGLDFEEQHKQALDLYHRLIREPFKNEDVKNQAKVKDQNKLLQETCTALNGDLSKVKTIEKEKVEDLNRKVAKLQKEVNNP